MKLAVSVSVVSVFSLLCAAPAYGAGARCDAPLPVYSQPPISGGHIVQAIAVGSYGDSSPSKALPHEHKEENVEWLCHLPVYDSMLPPDTTDELCYFQQIFAEPYGDFAQRIWKGNCTTAQLTLKGANKLYKVGAALRSIYVERLGLLDREYNASKVFLAAIPTQRTKQSMFSLMLGLYPVETRNGETIEYTSYDESVDIIKPNVKACPRLSQLYSSNKKSAEWTQKMGSLKETLEKINRIADTTGDSTWDDKASVSTWYDTLRARSCGGIPLPCKGSECVSQEDAQKIFDQADFENNNLMLGDETLRLASGPILSFVDETITAKIHNPSSYDFVYLSGELDSIAAIQSALGKPDGVPPYGSVMVFELWANSENAHFVRLMYNDKPLQISACHNPELCSISEFFMTVRNKFVIRDISQCDAL